MRFARAWKFERVENFITIQMKMKRLTAFIVRLYRYATVPNHLMRFRHTLTSELFIFFIKWDEPRTANKCALGGDCAMNFELLIYANHEVRWGQVFNKWSIYSFGYVQYMRGYGVQLSALWIYALMGELMLAMFRLEYACVLVTCKWSI